MPPPPAASCIGASGGGTAEASPPSSEASPVRLLLSSFGPLEAAARQLCPRCRRSRAYFCYDCLEPLLQPLPRVQLPVEVCIVMHGESNAQATGTHTAVLAPDSVTLLRHGDGTSHHRRQDPLALRLPCWDPGTTAVLFPETPDTPVIAPGGWLMTLDEWRQRQQQQQQQPARGQQELHAQESNSAPVRGPAFPFPRVVVLEGNWAKSRGLLRHPALARLPRVQLPPSVRTAFWRRGEGTFRGALDHGVCTIEAVWHLARLLAPAGRWDDLLWLFAYQRQRVALSGSRITRANLRRHIAPLEAAALGGGGEGELIESAGQDEGEQSPLPLPVQGMQQARSV